MAEKTTPQKSKTTQRLIIILLVLLLIAVCALLFRTFMGGGDNAEEEVLANPKLAYADGTTVVRDANALQNAVDELAQKVSEGNMMLEYDAVAQSTDGQNFSCYLANAQENSYDMYFDMYASQSLEDEIYLSGLVPPGKALDKIKLNKKLDPGTYTVYMAFTTVEDDHETIHAQVMVTMTLQVTGK